MRKLLVLAVVLLAIISCEEYHKGEAWEFTEPKPDTEFVEGVDATDTDTTKTCLQNCKPSRKPKLLKEGYISFHFECEGDDPNEVLINTPKDEVKVKGNCWTLSCHNGGEVTFCFEEAKDATATTDG